MIDFDKMTVAEHEEYKEMARQAKMIDRSAESYEHFNGYKAEDLQNIGIDARSTLGTLKHERRD